MSDIDPRFVTLKRINGHFEAVGPAIQSFETEQEASDARDALANQHHGLTFAVFSLVEQHTVKPLSVIERVKNGKPTNVQPLRK